MGLYGAILTLKDTKMDITLGQVVSVALIQHKQDSVSGYYTTLEIETEKGKVNLYLFSGAPIVLKLGRDD